jgi:hypothetical protein
MSISVSLWSDSEELVLYYEKLNKIPLPFEAEWSVGHKMIAAQILINLICEKVETFGSNLKNEFVSELVAQRYVPIFGISRNETHHCNIHSSKDFPILAELSSKFEERAENIANVLREMETKFLDDSIRNILLGNYIEFVAEFLFGAESVNEFLQNCF